MSRTLTGRQRTALDQLESFGPSNDVLNKIRDQIESTIKQGNQVLPQECALLYSRALIYSRNAFCLHGGNPCEISQEDFNRIVENLTKKHFQRV